MRKVPKQTYIADPEQMALWPDISGNRINGLGETEVRRPSRVYWHDPESTPHGHLQTRMRGGPRNPDLAQKGIENLALQQTELATMSADRVEQSASAWAQQVRGVAFAAGAQIVGVAAMDPIWIFEGYEVNQPWIVIIGVAMDHEILSTAPESTAAVEVMEQYNQGLRTAIAVANWIRAQGHDADAHSGPAAGPVNLIPAALKCGFGELGKHGSIINREYGASFRLACVLTCMPLVADVPDAMGADYFCSGCQICTRDCPAGAISEEKQMVRGVEKWYVDFDKCLPFFNEHSGCALCLAVCPWSTPGRASKLARKMERRVKLRENM